MVGFGRILVAFDGSQNSLAACEAASCLARSQGSEVMVIHVISATGVSRASQRDNQNSTSAEKMMDEACSLIKNEGVSVGWKVIKTDSTVVDAIIEYASQEKYDLIVLGAKGLGGFKTMLVGSVSNGVVAHAQTPVLVVRPTSPRKGPPFSRILVAVDGSENALRAAEVAAGIATNLGAELTILHVMFIPAAVYGSASTSVIPLEKQTRQRAEEYTSAAKTVAKKQGTEAKLSIVEDVQSPVGGITGYAEEKGTDLIVVGTRGLGGFKKLVLGSVASGVVNYAHCSVLVVRGAGHHGTGEPL